MTDMNTLLNVEASNAILGQCVGSGDDISMLRAEVENLTAERDDYKGKLNASVSLLTLEKKCLALAKERVAELDDILRKQVDHFVGAHDPDCPEDDTCNCSGKELNDRINEILS
jgi:hypothetical protein